MLVSKSKCLSMKQDPFAFHNDDTFSVPLQQTYEPANTYSLVLDRDYFAVSPEYQFRADSRDTDFWVREKSSGNSYTGVDLM